MGGSNTRFSHESLQDAKTIKSLISALGKGFAKGSLTLGDGGDELVLHPDGLMTVRIKAERENGQCQVNLRVSWADGDAPSPRRDSPRIDS
ncbi:MAG: amphi-Trp domain-containing protein [Marinibacterium sp.]|nr:amphi-Trp domain-containing protein [Marinibacterium sp.]